ncbi:hypothetical protein PAMP_002161 [Pampus punctatissimus]
MNERVGGDVGALKPQQYGPDILSDNIHRDTATQRDKQTQSHSQNKTGASHFLTRTLQSRGMSRENMKFLQQTVICQSRKTLE